MTADPGVFDAAAVASLTGHPDDAAFAVVFVTCFRDRLPERVRRIRSVLLGDDPGDDLGEALDAVLSLKASAAMVGAGELCELAGRLEARLRQGEWRAAAVLAADPLPDAADRATRALTAYLDYSASSIR